MDGWMDGWMDPFVTDYDTSYCTMTVLFFMKKKRFTCVYLLLACCFPTLMHACMVACYFLKF